MNKHILIMIPARGGSKGVPRKNVKAFAGKPLIAWAVEKALASKIGKCIVSTDDPEIANIAEQYGAEIPFLRPADISNDTANLLQVAAHTLSHFDSIGVHYDAIITVHTTTPLIPHTYIDKEIDIYTNSNHKAIATVTEILHGHPFQALEQKEDGTFSFFLHEIQGEMRFSRHKRQKLYYPNCGVYLRDRSIIKSIDRATNGLGERPYGLIVPQNESIDIDTEHDFAIAEILMREKTRESQCT